MEDWIRKLKNFRHLLQAIIANIIYRFPSIKLSVIGVTGTDGKTTTVHLIKHILESAGKKVDLISSVSAPGLHTTTPDSLILQKLLRQMVNQKNEYVVLEATSHGLDQNRLWGVKFDIGVITNVTHEHLDYHETFEKYLAAKAKLFKRVKIAVLNRDDLSYDNLKSKIKKKNSFGIQKSKIITYGIKNKADITPKKFPFKTSLPGEYNQYNCLAAITVAKSLGISDQNISQGIGKFKSVPGRMEEINERQNFKIYVDFAHTPNALENVLREVAKWQSGKVAKLIVIFGCAGLRDKNKRPLMGEIANRYADMVILTAEDPRTEDVNQIIEQIAVKCPKAIKIPDRREAIRYAIKIAKQDDLVIICGKGHEKSMCFGKTEYPWSDQEEVRKALKNV